MEHFSLSLPLQEAAAVEKYPGLHSVRKPTAKPWKRPNLPPPPKVYRVDPRGFRRLVQRLTGATQPASRPLKDTAPTPPPLDLVPRMMLTPTPPPPPPPPPAADEYNVLSLDGTVAGPVYQLESTGRTTPRAVLDCQTPTAGFLSPSLYSAYKAWCSFPLLSPGTMASFDHTNNAVL